MLLCLAMRFWLKNLIKSVLKSCLKKQIIFLKSILMKYMMVRIQLRPWLKQNQLWWRRKDAVAYCTQNNNIWITNVRLKNLKWLNFNYFKFFIFVYLHLKILNNIILREKIKKRGVKDRMSIQNIKDRWFVLKIKWKNKRLDNV